MSYQPGMPPSQPYGYGNAPYGQQQPKKSNTTTIVLIVVGVLVVFFFLCGGLLVALLLPAIQAARNAARQMETQNQIKRIGLGFHLHHDVHGHFPAAVTLGPDGRPSHGWRAELLPMTTDEPIAKSWDTESKWNSPSNSGLLTPTPECYLSAIDSSEMKAEGLTRFVGIRHPQSLLPGTEPVDFRDITDGTDNTVLAFYSDKLAGVPWAAPEDVTADEAFQIWSEASPSHPIIIVMGDGSVHVVHQPLSRQVFNALMTRNGGEPVSDF